MIFRNMVPDDRDAVHRELRSIKRWLVVVAILLAGVTLGTLSDLNAAPTWLGAPLLVTVFGTLLGGPVYLIVSLFREPPDTEVSP
ncbi:hypothetical protein SVXHr_0749 [Halorhabdus sp. SVX81]|nr:hypothetical protein SVXHr_0749 [Halorhabdus sp. SVX81]